MLAFYRVTLGAALRHPLLVVLIWAAMIALNVNLFRGMTYDLFPVQDTGLLIGSIQGDQSISFQAMKQKLAQLQGIVQADPAVQTVAGVTGGRQPNSGFVYISLKPFAERQITADGVVARLRGKLAAVAGARLFMVAVSDLRTGGRQSNATYQYTLLSDDTAELYKWSPRLLAALQGSQVLKDVNSDQQQGGLEADVTIDRAGARRLGLSIAAIDNTLYDAFGQRQVSTIYNALNQYHVVMEVAPRYWQDPSMLNDIWVSTSGSNPSGVQQTNARAGLFSSLRRERQLGGDDRQRLGAQPRLEFARRQRPFERLGRRGGGDRKRDDGAAVGGGDLQPRPNAAGRQSPGPVRRLDHLVQPRARPCAERGAEGDRRRRGDDPHALDRARRLRRHRRDLPAVAGDAAAAVRRGAARRLHRPRHSLRELHPSADDHLDPAVGQRRRADRA